MTAMTEMPPALAWPRAGRSSSGQLRSRRRRLGITAAAAAAALTLAACGSSGGSSAKAGPEKKDLVVAAVAGEGAGGLYVAQDEGLFAKVGLHVKIEAVTSSSTVIPAMLHGSVDVASGQYTSYFAADAAGAAQLRVIAAGYNLGPHVQEIIVPAHSTITSLAGLKGQTIAVNAPDSETTDLLYTALAPFGITPAQVHITVIPFPAMPAALASGHIAAAFEIEPFITEAVKQFGARELADIDSGASAGLAISGYAVLASWARKYPKTAAAFASAIRQGNALATTNLADLQKAFSIQLHLSAAITGVMAIGTFPTTTSSVQLQRVADMMLKYHQLNQAFQVKPIIGA
jgi:NitT/TauT family transport system substrate-binding protein